MRFVVSCGARGGLSQTLLTGCLTPTGTRLTARLTACVIATGERSKWPVSIRVYCPRMTNPTLAGNRAPEFWAEVRAHDRVMRYRRTGVGRTVLVLRSIDDTDPLFPELLEELSAGVRLIVPEPPAADVDVASWLADFLEGLGVSNVRILAVDRFCIPALDLAILQTGQITRLVLVPDRAEHGGTLEKAAQHLTLPLLVVQRWRPASEVLPLITGFLDGDRTAPP